MAKKRPAPPPNKPNRAVVIAAVVIAVIAITAIVAWAANRDSGDTAAEPARIEHIHGLGIDPADGMLYAAAHNGVFRVPDNGVAVRSGEGEQDTMGFTIAGPKHFLGSGHPAPGQGGPSHLGLIESTDAAVTWNTVSMAGKADFHALRYAHDTVFGFNSVTGQFLVSSEKTTWEARSSLAMRDFVVSPADPNVLLATTGQGVMRSADQGHTWTPAGGPPLALLDWQQTDELWGISVNGEVFTSGDGGQTWNRTGAANGQATAFTTHGDTLYLALHTGAIVESQDQGATWSIRYR